MKVKIPLPKNWSKQQHNAGKGQITKTREIQDTKAKNKVKTKRQRNKPGIKSQEQTAGRCDGEKHKHEAKHKRKRDSVKLSRRTDKDRGPTPTYTRCDRPIGRRWGAKKGEEMDKSRKWKSGTWYNFKIKQEITKTKTQTMTANVQWRIPAVWGE